MIFSREELEAALKQANYIDCRINAFPVYTGYKGINRQPPDFIFIDLDKDEFTDSRAFQKALDSTLNMIRQELRGTPTVIWSGNGYHIYLPIQNLILEQEPRFAIFTQPSVKFLRFAERWLSKGTSDPSHKPSFNSCLIRIPGTYNSKCMTDGIPVDAARVKIIQKWDGNRTVVKGRVLLEFYHELVDEKVKQLRCFKMDCKGNSDRDNQIRWIELLFQTPIPDYRKNAVGLILAPYLINIRNMSEQDALNVINNWLQECQKLKPLDSDFKLRVRYAIRHARNYGSKPLRFATLKERNRELYDLLRKSLGAN